MKSETTRLVCADRCEEVCRLERDLAEAREQLRLANIDNFNTTADLAEARECRGCGAPLVCSNADCNNHAAVSVLEDEDELNSRIAEAVTKERERCAKAAEKELAPYLDGPQRSENRWGTKETLQRVIARIRQEAGEGEK